MRVNESVFEVRLETLPTQGTGVGCVLKLATGNFNTIFWQNSCTSFVTRARHVNAKFWPVNLTVMTVLMYFIVGNGAKDLKLDSS